MAKQRGSGGREAVIERPDRGAAGSRGGVVPELAARRGFQPGRGGERVRKGRRREGTD